MKTNRFASALCCALIVLGSGKAVSKSQKGSSLIVPLGTAVSDCGKGNPPMWLSRMKEMRPSILADRPTASQDATGRANRALTRQVAAPASAVEAVEDHAFVIPAGTKIPVVLEDAIISSMLSKVEPRLSNQDQSLFGRTPLPEPLLASKGLEVRARTQQDIDYGGKAGIPAHSLVYGHATSVYIGHHMDAYALAFDCLVLPNGTSIAISALPVERGGVLRVIHQGVEVRFDASIIKIVTSDRLDNEEQRCWVGLISGRRGKNIDLEPGDEIKLEAREDIRSSNVVAVPRHD